MSPTASRFRAVILDYGKVLCQTPLEDRVKRIADVFGWTPAGFWAAFEKHRPDYDKGLISCAQFWRNMIDGTGATPSPEIFAQLPAWDIDMWTCLEPAMINWLRSLQDAGYKTALLSNAPLEFAQYARREFPWLKTFDACIFSAEIQLAKPDPAIFQRCLSELHVSPAEALFIDDVRANIDGAKTAGLAAIQFESVQQLVTELCALGFRTLPKTSLGS